MAKAYLLICTVFITVLCGDSPAQQLPVRDRIEKTYLAEIGTREQGGNNRGSRVAEYLRSTGLDEGYAWCAAFVKWVYTRQQISTPGANAWSPSWFPDNRTIYRRDRQQNGTPGKGDVFGLYYPNLKRIGHVGIVHEWSDTWVITVEGNTNEGGSREGDGVYKKKRLKRQIYAVSDFITHHP
jgi:hypothetical protein